VVLDAAAEAGLKKNGAAGGRAGTVGLCRLRYCVEVVLPLPDWVSVLVPVEVPD
jgi:hypothetical protein